MEYYKYLLSGLLIVGLLHQGFAKATKQIPTSATDDMQGDDDYNYSDDDSETVSDTETTDAKSTLPPSLQDAFLKKIAIEGEDLHLKCLVLNRARSNVILWYHGNNLLSNQLKSLNDRYKIKNTTTSYTLIINDIKMKDAGEYYCKVHPQNLQLQVSVNVLPKGSTREPTTADIPTTSIKPTSIKATSDPTTDTKSNNYSIRIETSFGLIMSLVLSMLTFLRI